MLTPFSQPLYVMLKPAGAACNLRCDYCYYLEKARLYRKGSADTSLTEQASRLAMSDEVLETFVRQYIESQTSRDILFAWHGGEPLLRPVEFYAKALKLQKKYGRGRHIENCIQTNGTLLNDKWCEFLKQNHFLVGISIDGTQRMHDAFRTRADGTGSWERVMNGINLLKRHGMEWNAMAVVNSLNVDKPEEFYAFFKYIGAQYIQFAPIVERVIDDGERRLASPMDNAEGGMLKAELTETSVSPTAYGRFLCNLFDIWVKQDVGKVFIQLFDSTLARWMGVQPGVCFMAENCGHAAVMEHNGDVYCCDHFVFPQYKLGNIKQKTITEMMYSDVQKRFGAAKKKTLPDHCRACEWLFACNGGCPKDRFVGGTNYLCPAFRMFFAHVAPYMDAMKRELLAGRPAAGFRL